jgi:hypothetical protein
MPLPQRRLLTTVLQALSTGPEPMCEVDPMRWAPGGAIIIRDAIANISSKPQTLGEWLNITLLLYNVTNNLSMIDKMVQSHSIAESVMFGLLHDDASGWNAYDDNNPNLND